MWKTLENVYLVEILQTIQMTCLEKIEVSSLSSNHIIPNQLLFNPSANAFFEF